MKKMITLASVSLMLLAGTGLLMVSCKKTADLPANGNSKNANANTPEKNKKIYVTTVAELYAAVNNTGNEGSEVNLAPGIYVLSNSYPNGGRLDLQTDMSLKGVGGDMSAVWIDLSSLPTASFVIPAGRTGGIRMGKGENSLEWLSIKGAPVTANPFSVINTDLLSTETTCDFKHLFIDMNGSNLGINLRNRLAEHANRKIYSTIADCEVTGGVNFNGAAIALQNANNASGALIDVTMRNNYLHGNKIGLLAFSTNQTQVIGNCSILVKSYNDRFEGNGVGLDPTAGANQSTTTTCNNNTTIIEMHDASIRFNNPAGMPQLTPVNGALPGGIYAACAYNGVNNVLAFNRASNNVMKVELFSCDISDNNGPDITGFAAWCPPATLLGGSNNLLDILLHGCTPGAAVNATASSPVEPAGTNVVNVIQN